MRILFVFITIISQLMTISTQAGDRHSRLGRWGNVISSYEGHWEGGLADSTRPEFRKVAVRSDWKFSDNGVSQMPVKDLEGHDVVVLRFDKISGNQIVLRLPGVNEAPLDLRRENDCFWEAKAHKTFFCFTEDNIDLEVYDSAGTARFSVSFSRFFKFDTPKQEEPKSYSLDEAVQRTLKLNFDTRVEFQHFVQARALGRQAYLNLIPHLSANSILSNITPTWISVFTNTATDFVPFLLPSRWLMAKRAGLQSEAERYALVLMRLDSVTTVEATFYYYLQLQAVQKLYENTLKMSQKLMRTIQNYQDWGLYPPDAVATIYSTVNDMQDALIQLKVPLAESRMAIAQSMGFINPDAVAEAVFDSTQEVNPIERAAPFDYVLIRDTALNRSYELNQIKYFQKIADNQKKSLWWNWLDPAGDPTQNLGLNLIAAFDVAKSVITEWNIRAEQAQGLIENKAKAATLEYNNAVEAYVNNKKGVENESTRLHQIIDHIDDTNGERLDLFHLNDILQAYLTKSLRQQNNLMVYRLARSKIDRLLLQGYYTPADEAK